MTATVEREGLSELAVQAGWHHRDADRTDYYTRSPVRVHVHLARIQRDQRGCAVPR